MNASTYALVPMAAFMVNFAVNG